MVENKKRVIKMTIDNNQAFIAIMDEYGLTYRQAALKLKCSERKIKSHRINPSSKGYRRVSDTTLALLKAKVRGMKKKAAKE